MEDDDSHFHHLGYRKGPILIFHRCVHDEVVTPPLPERQAIEVAALVGLKAKPLPRLGGRAQRIQLCQPRVTKMAYYPNCCGYPRKPTNDCISNSEGTNLGDLFFTAKELREQHEACDRLPHESGYAPPMVPGVVFQGLVELASDDLRIVAAVEKAKEAGEMI